MKFHPKCDLCDSPATVFVSMVIGKEVTQACYCKKHAIEKGILNSQAYELGSKQLALMPSLPKKGPICPNCGYTLEDCEKKGLMGCIYCYTTFLNLIQGSLKHIHKRSLHLGKVPKRIPIEVRQKHQELLNQMLKEMIVQERYEDAAKIKGSLNAY